MKPERSVLVLGGGLAGLSAAYHLRRDRRFQTLVLEKSGQVGGTARSVRIKGFTFDFTGHLLHLHFDYTKQLIRKLLGKNIYTCERKAAIHSNDMLTPYPFQAHTYGLPARVVRDCVEGFREAVEKYSDPAARATSLAFEDWSRRTFGAGIHKHFMKPYNEKLWQVRTTEMTAEWCGMFVPQPKLEDVVRGSREDTTKVFGYNATFLYPKKGGIQVLAEALGRGLPVQLNTGCEEVDWKARRARDSRGKWHSYDRMVNTMPLAELLKRMKGLPPEIADARDRLRCTSVICINLGVRRAGISDKSWIYFPEKKYVFYRVGFPMNFTPHVVPKGCSSMYVEVSHPSGKKYPLGEKELLKRVRAGLEDAGILRKSDQIAVADVIPIKHAYVIYTPDRKEVVGKILSFLDENGIQSIGRYGEWKYSFMEEAILDGKKAAEKIQAGN